MSSLALAQALWSIAITIWFLLGLFVYLALIRQVSVRAIPVGESAPKRFGIPEALIAALLMSLLVLNLMSGAPAAEELVFRFFLYGVLKRYFGIIAGLVINALLFAAVHQHLPSFAPLLILWCCFTLAYEWTGSILVPMAMHALINSANLILFA